MVACSGSIKFPNPNMHFLPPSGIWICYIHPPFNCVQEKQIGGVFKKRFHRVHEGLAICVTMPITSASSTFSQGDF